MGLSDKTIQELAEKLAARIEPDAAHARPKLRLIRPPRPTRFDSITRDCCIRRVRDLQRLYGLGWLVRQEMFDQPSLETLEDEQLAAVHKTIESAAECIREGISLEDAGYLRPNLTEHHL